MLTVSKGSPRGHTLVNNRTYRLCRYGRGFPSGKHTLRIFRPGFAAPGKQHGVLFSARTGRQALGNLIRPYGPPSPEGKALTRKGKGVSDMGF